MATPSNVIRVPKPAKSAFNPKTTAGEKRPAAESGGALPRHGIRASARQANRRRFRFDPDRGTRQRIHSQDDRHPPHQGDEERRKVRQQ